MAEDVRANDDLAGGVVGPEQEKVVNGQLRLDTQRFWFRWLLFVFALFAISGLGWVFFELEHAVSNVLEKNPSTDIHWPVLALCSITLLGASALMHSVLRSVFRPDGGKKEDEGFEIPQVEVLKQIVEVLKVARGTTKE